MEIQAKHKGFKKMKDSSRIRLYKIKTKNTFNLSHSLEKNKFLKIKVFKELSMKGLNKITSISEK